MMENPQLFSVKATFKLFIIKTPSGDLPTSPDPVLTL